MMCKKEVGWINVKRMPCVTRRDGIVEGKVEGNFQQGVDGGELGKVREVIKG